MTRNAACRVCVALGALAMLPAIGPAVAAAQTLPAELDFEATPRLGGDASRDEIIDGALTPDAEGNPDGGTGLFGRAIWLSAPCHRSMLSGAAQTALQIERGNRTSTVSFVPLGCSGATIDHGLLGEYGGIAPEPGRTFPAQVELVNALAERREIDALILSVGANDVGFSKIETGRSQHWPPATRPWTQSSPTESPPSA